MTQQVKALVKQISASASRGTVRNHSTICDRPEAKGGSNQGPMGGELLLVGLGGCFMSNLLAAIEARKADVSNLSIEIDATLEDAPPRFSQIVMSISGDYQDKAMMQKLVTVAERGCIAANTIKPAVDLRFKIL